MSFSGGQEGQSYHVSWGLEICNKNLDGDLQCCDPLHFETGHTEDPRGQAKPEPSGVTNASLVGQPQLQPWTCDLLLWHQVCLYPLHTG